MNHIYPSIPPGASPPPGMQTCKYCNGWGVIGTDKFGFGDGVSTCPKCWGDGKIKIKLDLSK